MRTNARLGATMRHKFQFDGDYTIDPAKTHVILPGFTAYDDEGKERKLVNAGSTVTLVSDTAFRVMDRIAFIRTHPELYKLGTVQCVPLVSPGDDMVKIEVQFTATQRTDLKRFPYLIELYVGD